MLPVSVLRLRLFGRKANFARSSLRRPDFLSNRSVMGASFRKEVPNCRARSLALTTPYSIATAHLPGSCAIGGNEPQTFLYAFDLMELNGTDLRWKPIEVHKATLGSAEEPAGPAPQRAPTL